MCRDLPRSNGRAAGMLPSQLPLPGAATKESTWRVRKPAPLQLSSRSLPSHPRSRIRGLELRLVLYCRFWEPMAAILKCGRRGSVGLISSAQKREELFHEAASQFVRKENSFFSRTSPRLCRVISRCCAIEFRRRHPRDLAYSRKPPLGGRG